ncbi:ribbon-helix-helix protein, CopG family [Rhodopila globiformis]|uniref:CopG family transcriptional regulator n=1 Tax=Rhodopila globiformis TaxID=1071 RepID=A0A2S6NHE0_RHOGL|nr:ribbon-helix-helix protein, CopG family [Rhodopila globiformis]PPQ34020.1 CopG family transcriptional regulator [Rhodopila globiformis]
MRDRLNLSLPVEMITQINDLATRRRLTRSAIVEAAVASFLSPDGADRLEAAFARRLDRLTRQVQRLERDSGLSTEALALFIRFWLTITPPLPSDAQATAQAKGRERYEGFIEALGRRLNQGRTLRDEIPMDLIRPDSRADEKETDHDFGNEVEER